MLAKPVRGPRPADAGTENGVALAIGERGRQRQHVGLARRIPGTELVEDLVDTVPDAAAALRVPVRRPRERHLRHPAYVFVAIHVRGEDGYRESLESMAFPGWKAEEIRLALTEEPLSGRAWRALERVALAMGTRQGTGPENDPLIRSMSRRAQSRGDAEGYARGRMEAVVAVLSARGIEVSPVFTTDLDLLAGRPVDALMAAALACTDEADLRGRLREAAE